LRYARINADGNAPIRSGVAAAPRITGRRQQTSMSKRIGHRGNCCGCLHLTKPLVVYKEESSIVHQGPSDARAELVAHERWDRTVTQIEVVPGIEGGVSVEFKQRSMEVVTS